MYQKFQKRLKFNKNFENTPGIFEMGHKLKRTKTSEITLKFSQYVGIF